MKKAHWVGVTSLFAVPIGGHPHRCEDGMANAILISDVITNDRAAAAALYIR